MNNAKQKVEIYYGMLTAKQDMIKHISDGWRVHTCTMGAYVYKKTAHEKIIVIYEKPLETWN